MTCRICKKNVGTRLVQDGWYLWIWHRVVAFHLGRNGKPCSAVGEKGK